MIVIGIVGSPAGGKSTIAGILEELGGTWINADLVARETLELAEVRDKLLDHFGPEIADEGGRINRSQLAGRVFGDDESSRSALKYLESVVHPITRSRISGMLEAQREREVGDSVAILDIPLLFESGWDVWCDEVICVTSPEEIRRVRAESRGWSLDELRRREKNQLSIEEKKRRSTFVINNDGDLESLRRRIVEWFGDLKQRRAAASL